MCPTCQTLRNAGINIEAGALLVLLVPGLGRTVRIGFENSVNLIRTGQDLPYGVGDCHLLDNVTLPQPLLAIDKEAFDAAVGVRYLDFVAHAVRLAGDRKQVPRERQSCLDRASTD